MKTTPEFTEAEILAMMDFNQVLALTEAARQRSRKIIGRTLTAMLIIATLGGGYVMYQQNSTTDTGAQTIGAQPEVPSNTGPVEPPSRITAQPDTTLQSTGPVTSTEPKKVTKKLPVEENKKTEKMPSVRVDSVASVFLPAEPIDGYAILYEYFAKELRYPEEAIKDSIQGVVSVSFVISKEGKPEQVSTDHALGEVFDREAIRVIESMPAWKPAQLDGSPVRSKVSVPITFSVKTTKPK